jgi:DNA polymerase-1
MAEKVAMTLLITEEEAQEYLDAREAMFLKVTDWKLDTIEEAKRTGRVTTMMGAVRHLREALRSEDRSVSSKAERQAVNFRIQSSSAEQTKLAEGRMWKDGLFFDFDAVCYGPVHDEIVASVRICDLEAFLPRMHACMVAPYASMQVPIEGDISFGWDYYNQIEIGPRPTPEAIAKGVAKLLPEKEAA